MSGWVSSDRRQVAVKTDNVQAKCEIVDIFCRLDAWSPCIFSNVHQTMATMDISRADNRYSAEDLVATQNRNRFELLVPRIWVDAPFLLRSVQYGYFGVKRT